MNIKILDCTLRDGGYINNFYFGAKNKKRIVDKLCEANIDIIEIGFLRTGKNDPDCSLYGGVEQIRLPIGHKDKMFVSMIEYGGISADEIVSHKPEYIDGIRLTFHNNEWDNTRKLARNLMDKGYKVFIQPVGTMTYTDDDLLALITEINILSPFAFYLVDTLGSVFKKELLRFFRLVDENLDKNIMLGFHSHNNLLLSFANTIDLTEIKSDRNLIIDSSVFGMGRGAGNLATELITHFINKEIEKRYYNIPILELIDEIILPIFHKNPWGYNPSYYLSAIRSVHPNYATYLINKAQITIPQVDSILSKLHENTKHLYNITDIEQLYYKEMRSDVDDTEVIAELHALIGDRSILVIAPGNTVKLYEDKLTRYIIENNPFVIAVNFVPENITPDLIFFANNKRYLALEKGEFPIVISSNIKPVESGTLVVNYDTLISEDRKDNSGIMAIRLLIRLGVKTAILAGYDGFTNSTSYYAVNYETYLSEEERQKMNIDMAMQLGRLSDKLKIEYLTPTIYK